jgi:hypothetical protein
MLRPVRTLGPGELAYLPAGAEVADLVHGGELREVPVASLRGWLDSLPRRTSKRAPSGRWTRCRCSTAARTGSVLPATSTGPRGSGTSVYWSPPPPEVRASEGASVPPRPDGCSLMAGHPSGEPRLGTRRPGESRDASATARWGASTASSSVGTHRRADGSPWIAGNERPEQLLGSAEYWAMAWLAWRSRLWRAVAVVVARGLGVGAIRRPAAFRRSFGGNSRR